MRNYTMEELSEMIVDTILKEQFLNKKELVPKVLAHIKTLVDLKNIPKDYNEYESQTTRAARLRTIEQKQAEIVYWRDIVKRIDGENIEKYYKDQRDYLANKGFIKI